MPGRRTPPAPSWKGRAAGARSIWTGLRCSAKSGGANTAGGFDNAVKNATLELATSEGLTPQADKELREAIAALNAAFAEYRAEWVKDSQPGGNRPMEYRRLCEGKRHIEKLAVGAYQLVEMSRRQLARRESFMGGTIEDYMAYFERNNLRSAPATAANRSAYHQVFDMMVRYYLDQKMAANLQQSLDQELSELKHNDQAAIDAALGRTMSASDQALAQIQQLAAARDMLRAAQPPAPAPGPVPGGAGFDPNAFPGPMAGGAVPSPDVNDPTYLILGRYRHDPRWHHGADRRSGGA